MKKFDTIEAYFAGTDIHDEQRVGAPGMVAIVASLVFLALHAYNCWLYFFDQSISFGMAFVFHMLLSFAAGLMAFVFSGVHSENRFFLMLFMGTLTMGVFGAAGALLSMLLHIWYMRFAQPFSNWFVSIFPAGEENAAQQVYEDIQVGRDESSKPYSVIAFMDVIQYGSESQKRTALAKMTSRFHPSFAPAFKRALNDSSNNIRIQAATAISKIENQFMAKLMKLNELLAGHPKNPVITLAIAQHYDDYAFTGILDSDRERLNRAKALDYYKQYLEINSEDAAAYVKIGRLLMRNGEAAKALDWLRKSVHQGHSSPALFTWYAEALYACGHYGELRQLAQSKEWKEFESSLNPVLADSLALWTNVLPAVAAAATPTRKMKKARV